MSGRTDNEIKNYWRTRIQKHLKQSENFTTLPLSNIEEPIFTNQVHSSCAPADHALSQSYAPNNATSSFQGNMQSFQGPNFQTQSNDHNIWGMEDFWSMQLLH